MTPFLSVQLVLLFMFIVANYQPDLPLNGVDVPKVAHPVPMRRANREDAIVVAVQRNGRVWLGNDRLSPDQLPTRIRQAVNHGAERKIYIRADARAKYGAIAEVLDSVRIAGIENIAFLMDERKPPSTHP